MLNNPRFSAWLEAREKQILLVFLALLFWRLTVAPLPSSFWIDETGTVWAATGRLPEVLENLSRVEFPQMYLYSLLIWVWTQLAGTSEVALRLPSTILHVLDCYLLYRLARKLFPSVPLAGLYTVVMYYSLTHVAYASVDARPYELALCFLLWSFHERVNWLATGGIGPIVRHGVAAGLTISTNYFFGAALIADFFYLLYAHFHQNRPFTARLLLSPLISFLIFLPQIPIILVVLRQSAMHIVGVLPTWTDLGVQWFPPRILVVSVVASAFYFLFGPGQRFNLRSMSELPLALVLHWALWPAAILFGYSLATGKSVFLPRYLLSQAPGIALLFGALPASVPSPLWRIPFATCLVAISLQTNGYHLWANHYIENWRDASAIVTKWHAEHPSAPVLVGSSYVESRYLPMPISPERKSFLLTPLKAYPIPLDPVYLPLDTNEHNRPFVLEAFEDAARSPMFLVMTPESSPLNPWMDGYLTSRFTSKTLLENPRVIVFERRPPER